MAGTRLASCVVSIGVTLGCLSGPAVAAPLFVRGDSNADGTVQITDAVHTLLYLFRDGVADLACLDAADADDDGAVVLNDAVFVLNFLFRSGDPLPFPFPHCSIDPTADDLECEDFPACGPSFPVYGQDLAGDGFFFVVDRSGSMQDSGELEIAKREIIAVVQELSEASQFAIVIFDNGVLKFPSAGVPASATKEIVALAVAWLESVRGGSGSCFELGMIQALQFVESSTVRRKAVIYIGDGGGTCQGQNERTYLDRALDSVTARNDGRAQINAFGVLMSGRTFHEGVLRELASRNGGLYTRVEN